MLKVSFLNMPFASLEAPSLALTQLKSAVERQHGDSVKVDNIQYLNHDFGHYVGIDVYEFMSKTETACLSGLGDWFFRQSAFPDLPDNSEVYFRRYFPLLDDELKRIKQTIIERRDTLDDFLDLLISKYRLDEADIVGFTSMFWQNVGCFALAKRLKQRRPEIVIAMGGANCEAPMGQEIVKHVESVDYVFSGPSLKSFPQFIDLMLAGKREECELIKGVFTKGNVENPAGVIGEEIDINENDDLDYRPFLDSVKENFPNREVVPFLMFETSRGCWWGEKAHCTFCGLNGLTMKFRSMSPEKALAQFNTLFEKYGSECSRFDCVDNIMPTNYPKEVFPFLKTPSNVSIFYEVKADLTEEELQVISQARVKMIQPGIEALSTATLKLMKKGTSAFQNIAFIKNCLLYDVYPVWNILIGFPKEDESVYEKYIKDIPLLIHLPPPNSLLKVQFDRFSPYFTQADDYGLNLLPLDYYMLIYPFGKESLANLAYHFADNSPQAGYLNNLIKWIVELIEQVNAWRLRWQSKDSVIEPKLHLKEMGDATHIYDSRTGEAVEYEIGMGGKLVLEQLSKPKRISQVMSALKEGAADVDVAQEIEWLKERRLLFEEGDRLLSLVMPKDTPGFTLHFDLPKDLVD